MRASILSLLFTVTISAQELPVVPGVEHQSLAAQVSRLVEALQILGEPLPAGEVSQLNKLAEASAGRPAAVLEIQKILDRRCLVGVNISPESRVKVEEGPAKSELVEQGWRTFLVKVPDQEVQRGLSACNTPRWEQTVEKLVLLVTCPGRIVSPGLNSY